MKGTLSITSALAGLAALLALSGPAPARAQSVEIGIGFGSAPAFVEIDDRDWRRRGEDGERWRGRRILPPRAIVGSLYRRGYSDVEIRRRRGDSYVVEAVSRRGNRVVAVIDGRTTEITGLKVVDWRRPRRDFDDGGWNDPRPWSGPRW